MSNLFLLFLILLGVAGLWWHFDNMHRFALSAVRQRCRAMDVQLLDQTVVLRGLKVRRGESAWFILIAKYSFEFSTIGDRRYKGETELVGKKLLSIQLEPHII